MARRLVREQAPLRHDAPPDTGDAERRTRAPVRDRHARVRIVQQYARQVMQPQQRGGADAMVAVHHDAGVALDRDRRGPQAGGADGVGQAADVIGVHFFGRHEKRGGPQRHAVRKVSMHWPSPVRGLRRDRPARRLPRCGRCASGARRRSACWGDLMKQCGTWPGAGAVQKSTEADSSAVRGAPSEMVPNDATPDQYLRSNTFSTVARKVVDLPCSLVV